MPDYPINLAQAGHEIKMAMTSPMPPEEHYPCLYLEGGPELDTLPEEGIMRVSYKRVKYTEDVRNGGERYCVELDIVSILDAKPSQVETKDDGYGGTALDKLKAEVESAAEDAGEPGEE